MPKIHPKTLQFLSSVKKNNNRPWFDKNKWLYEEIRNDLITFTGELIKELNRIDRSIGSADPKKCVMRIYRDVRFSKDKSPYKTNFGIAISAANKMDAYAGYYIHLQPGSNFVGGGVWMPEAPTLKKIRQEIDYNFPAFKKIVDAPSFKKTFGKLDEEMKLTRPPKEYLPTNPAIEYLKLKSFVTGGELSDTQVLSPKFLSETVRIFKELKPLIIFLNQAIA